MMASVGRAADVTTWKSGRAHEVSILIVGGTGVGWWAGWEPRGGIGTHGELLLSEVVETSMFAQDGAPHPLRSPLDWRPTLDRAPRAAAIAAAI
jgi:hypothetical protein